MNTSFKDVSHKSGIAAKEGLMEPLFQVKNELNKKDIDRLYRLLWKYAAPLFHPYPLWQKFIMLIYGIFLLSNDTLRVLFPIFIIYTIYKYLLFFGYVPTKWFSFYYSRIIKIEEYRNWLDACPMTLTYEFYKEYISCKSSCNIAAARVGQIPYASLIAFREFDDYFIIYAKDSDSSIFYFFLSVENHKPLKELLLNHHCHIFDKKEYALLNKE